MARITDRLSQSERVGIDTSIFIYHIEAHPTYATLTRQVLRGLEEKTWQGVTSVLALLELSVHPWQVGQDTIAREYEALLFNFPHLDIAPVDREIARQAARLRAAHNLRTPDAIHTAASLIFDAQAFLTNDARLQRAEAVIPVMLLDDFVG